jgi:superfamily II RNA helicase
MLPKYRRLVEQLAQQGLLKVICGTDTLGVGINVPIRTVLLTALTKFDGTRMRQLNAREFHQIAGRAGRAGFDTAGTVVVQAPDHETENARLLAKAGDDQKKVKKIVRKKAPEGFVSWGEPSFARLIAAEPEKLTSSMKVSHAMILNVIGRGGAPFDELRELIENNHEPRPRQRELARQALSIYRTLRTAEIVQQDAEGTISLTVDLQPNFALNQPLSPFALAVFDLLQPAEASIRPQAANSTTDSASEQPASTTERSSTYALDLISVLEATLDDPRPVLSAQQFMARGEAVAAMKSEGIEYDQRMELLEEISYPKPLEELLDAAFAVYRASQPWVGDFELSPKSVVRDLYERAMTFNDYIGFYKLNRSEGLVLRYLSDAYRATRQTIPDEAKTEELLDLIEWLGELVRQVDSSLLDEWEQLINPAAALDVSAPVLPPRPHNVTTNIRAFRILVRNEMFRRVQLAALEYYDQLGELDAAAGFDEDAWGDAMDAYFDAHNTLGTGGDARSSAMLIVEEGAESWTVRQIFDDPAGDHDWGISATIDLAESNEAGVAVVRVTAIGML